jgi:cysteine desulfurase
VINLDNNATTQPTAAVVDAVRDGLVESWHNPSSVHRGGQEARRRVELARQDIADLIGAKARDVTFTSGGTESINIAVRGVLSARASAGRVPRLVTSRVEHAAVRDLADELGRTNQATLAWVDVTSEGLIDLDSFAREVKDADAAVVQWANNETGGIQPIGEIARLCREAGTTFICDATQWVGKMEVTVGEGASASSAASDAPRCDADIMVFSPHKFHGPKGVGVLWIRRGTRIRTIVHGSQELGRRGGTENVPGILGAGAAAREAIAWLEHPSHRQAARDLRDRLESAILAGVPSASVNGPRDHARRLWNTTNIGFPPLEAEVLVLYLSERGVAVSAGAACSSGSLEPSPVLLAMKIPEPIAHGSLRFSLSRFSTADDVDAAAAKIIEAVRTLQG